MDLKDNISWLEPEWPLPKGVRALVTTRLGGYSRGPYDSFNLAMHVGDQSELVLKNREYLQKQAYLPSQPLWLNQVHGVDIWSGANIGEIPTADGSVTDRVGEVLAILTADCLPVLFADEDGRVIAAAHAGWRGLSAGVLENAVGRMIQVVRPDALSRYKQSITAWLGPTIGQSHFEVGQEVKDAFLKGASADSQALQACFRESSVQGKHYADLHGLAQQRLLAMDIHQIYGKPHCCYEDRKNFYSYRRDKQTGRFASLIWKI